MPVRVLGESRQEREAAAGLTEAGEHLERFVRDRVDDVAVVAWLAGDRVDRWAAAWPRELSSLCCTPLSLLIGVFNVVGEERSRPLRAL